MKKSIIASAHLSNTMSINIIDIEYGFNDVVKFIYSGSKRIHSAKIRYNMKGDAYFVSYGIRYYLNQFIKVNF